MLAVLIHGLAVVNFAYALYFHLLFPVGGNLPAHLSSNKAFSALAAYPGIWKYLTIWDIVLQLVYHSISLLNDGVGSSETNSKKQTGLQKLRDALFGSWAFPVGLFVSVTFWGLYAVDRELVFAQEMDAFYPSWLNHAVHTGPVAFLLLDLIFSPKTLPSRCRSMRGTMAFTVTYFSWITYVYIQNGVWAYPVLEILGNVERIAFFAASFLLVLVLNYVGEKLTKCRWGSCADSGGPAKAKDSGKGKKKPKRA